ncbi:MAG: isochorismate synthase [Acidobacteria bacterium]|nr:MAG: isochorismate synthase [Acidobacteriota bacterium]REK07313.1 MAG: isochorismate synthase [Acidobacteriota bacterium]
MTLTRVQRSGAGPRLAEAGDRLGRLDRPGAGSAAHHDDLRLFCVAQRGPRVDAARLLDLWPEDDGVYWEESGAEWVGLGVAAELRGEGPGRFAQLVQGAADLFSRLEVAQDDAPRPRLFGGLSFRPTIYESLWRRFGAASFVLPRVLVRCDEDESTWMLAVPSSGGSQAPAAPEADAEAGDEIRRSALAELERLRLRAQRLAVVGRPPGTGPRTTPAVRNVADEQWLRGVRSAVAAIEQGSLEKVVLARREVVALGRREPSVAAVLALLQQQAPESRRFVVRRSGALFVGATPERLVRRRGLDVETVALAGTVHRRPEASLAELGGQLMASSKDRHEHDLVVSALRSWLQPLCSSVEVPAEPGVRALRYLLHLETAIHAELKEPVHVLRLVEALHPTPAVGGRPRAAAVAWIDAHEQFDRGWYAAPVGWFDANGDGEFHVALRSLLLSEGRGYLYAGAGIVDESVAELEFAETEDKLQGIHAIVAQLGAPGATDGAGAGDAPGAAASAEAALEPNAPSEQGNGRAVDATA